MLVKYRIYQLLKYSLMFIGTVILIVYLAKTDRLPKFIPDDVRNSLVDFSDYLLSYDYIRSIYSPIESTIDFLADDGYSYKYNVVPRMVLERFDNELKSIDNTINLFLNNPLFETWIVPNLISSDGILEEVFRNYFPENLYVGFFILSSKFVNIFSLGLPKDENIKYFLNSSAKFKFYRDYFLVVRKLSRDLDFLEGFFVLVIDKNKFLNYVLNSEKSGFELVYIVQGNDVVYVSGDVSKEYLRDQYNSDVISILGNTFKQSVIDYQDFKICFVLPNPSWIRWVYIVLKLLLLAGVIVLLFYINRLIKLKIKQTRDIKHQLIKELKGVVSGKQVLGGGQSFSNLLVRTTEDSLKFFENFVEQDIKSTKYKRSKTSIFR
ncbi:MAG: hypothetical protein ACK4F9_01310 [Brevinematia bacterium]